MLDGKGMKRQQLPQFMGGGSGMTMSSELLYTALTALFTGLIWIPIVLNRFVEIGIWKTLLSPERGAQPAAEWAWRLANAHRNAVENLVVFAPLAITVHVLQLGTAGTALAAAIFFYARVAHAVVYALGAPILRTVAFLTGFGVEVYLAGRILGWF
jgi:uncharacterized MAPEG superfamily protein